MRHSIQTSQQCAERLKKKKTHQQISAAAAAKENRRRERKKMQQTKTNRIRTLKRGTNEDTGNEIVM